MTKYWPCEHIEYSMPLNVLLFKEHETNIIVQQDWLCCPKCGAKRPEKKKPKLMASAIYKIAPNSHDVSVMDTANYRLTEAIFDTEDGAKTFLGDTLVSWPAIPNKNGFYEVTK